VLDSALQLTLNASSLCHNHLKIINKKNKQFLKRRKIRFWLFAKNETVEPIYQNTNMELNNEPITEIKAPPPIFIRTVSVFSSFCEKLRR
jgi:hypothetical protein